MDIIHTVVKACLSLYVLCMSPSLHMQANDAVYTFTEGTPSDTFYFGARINDENPDYVDIILQANTVGWVAVGFSDTQSMVMCPFLLACVLTLSKFECFVGPSLAIYFFIVILAA